MPQLIDRLKSEIRALELHLKKKSQEAERETKRADDSISELINLHHEYELSRGRIATLQRELEYQNAIINGDSKKNSHIQYDDAPPKLKELREKFDEQIKMTEVGKRTCVYL
ncbi:unnamed protein product [Protopolystoma xenopodis]|uniref:Uncharacterized protein n=1 Tax=Protopolystoma xenopodis TaxID=117903 RepID=A0A448WHQ0_9PLAT|nr:unnamed protein product [Protopolystoma xenopodis]